MGILYANEHLSCINYQLRQGSTIELVDIEPNKKWEKTSKYNLIVFVLKGEISYYSESNKPKNETEWRSLLFLANTALHIESEKGARLMIIRVSGVTQLCDTYSLRKLLYSEKYNSKNKITSLKVNDILKNYLITLDQFISDGIKCISFFDMKVKELFLIFRAYYAKSDLLHFFYPLLSTDMAFSDFIQSNYTKVKTVKELADLSNYSLSGFQKKFKSVYNTPAHQWLTEQRMKAIYQDILNPKMSLKEICDKYQFSSQSYFNDYCKVKFGQTPGQLRKKQ